MSSFLNTNLESHYETMEAYFMRRSVERAFQLEKQDTSDAGFEVSSVVDDVMFILRKVTKRALSTCQIRTVSSIYAVVRRIMEQDYAGVLGRRMQDLQARIGTTKTGLVKSIETERRDVTSYCTLLNALDVSAENVDKIVKEQTEADLSFYGDDRDAVLRVLEVLGTLTSRFQRGLEDGVHVIYNTLIKNRIRTLLNETFTTSYVTSNEPFEAQSGTTSVRSNFEKEWTSLIVDPFESALSGNAYLMLLKVTVRAFIRVLEKKLLTIKCNELGAIKLDRDVSSIIQLCSSTYSGIRDRFDRVREIMYVVNWSADDAPDDGGAEIIQSLGLVKIGVEEVDMIRREMMVP